VNLFRLPYVCKFDLLSWSHFENFVDTESILTVFQSKVAAVVALWLKEALVCQEYKRLLYPIILNYFE
jgi:hypothetical protein